MRAGTIEKPVHRPHGHGATNQGPWSRCAPSTGAGELIEAASLRANRPAGREAGQAAGLTPAQNPAGVYPPRAGAPGWDCRRSHPADRLGAKLNAVRAGEGLRGPRPGGSGDLHRLAASNTPPLRRHPGPPDHRECAGPRVDPREALLYHLTRSQPRLNTVLDQARARGKRDAYFNQKTTNHSRRESGFGPCLSAQTRAGAAAGGPSRTCPRIGPPTRA